MIANVEEMLRKRYGGDRFNPAEGQMSMSFEEWMDRHPALQGRGGDKNFAAYQTAVSPEGGNEYYKGRSVGGQIAPPKQVMNTPDSALNPGAPVPTDDPKKQMSPGMGLPSPDKPAPNRAQLGPALRQDPGGKPRRLDRAVNNIKGANKGMKPAAAAGAAGRRKGGNVQKQHPKKKP